MKNQPIQEDATLRDYFAGLAMQAMLSSGNLPKSVKDSELAAEAFVIADAMMEARK
jgi:hypothetical protein